MYTPLHTLATFFHLLCAVPHNQLQIFDLNDYTRSSRFLAPASHKSSLLQLTGMWPFPRSTL